METPLLRWIADRIAEQGPIPFATFMDWALYHPEHGYYASGQVRVGEDQGDFTTAPHLTVLFARCLVRLVRIADDALGGPDPFVLAEGGPGEGRLARDMLDCLREESPALYSRLRYAPDESSPALRLRQKCLWTAHQDRIVEWPPRTPVEGLYLSNELLDAFPVHRLTRRDGRLWEVHVDSDGSGLTEVLRPPSRPELLGGLPPHTAFPEGCEMEVNLGVTGWLSGVSAALARGYVVTIDYGDEASRLYGVHRPRGTVRGYRTHRVREELLATPGLQDLTAHVDFTALREAGEALGLQASRLLPLRDFLVSLGLLEQVNRLEERCLSALEALEARRAAAPLLLPDPGMGESFKALVQARGAPLEALQLDADRTPREILEDLKS